MNASDLKIAIVGATGAVGRVALRLLADRGHPAERVVVMASTKSVGKKLTYGQHELVLEPANPDRFTDLDVVFISASSEVSRQIAPQAVRRGALVIDDSATFRLHPAVPLVIPEVNGEDVERHAGIVSIPNCSVTPLAMVLKPLSQVANLTGAHMATYQSVSGAGSSARTTLDEETRKVLEGTPADTAGTAFNVVPKIGDLRPDGFTDEEHKTVTETSKILHREDLHLSATCVRVAVHISHGLAIHAVFDQPPTIAAVSAALRDFDGITLAADGDYVTAREAAGQNDVFVSRVRLDGGKGILLWVVCDNLLKGAALNALQIMDEIAYRGSLKPKLEAQEWLN